VQLGTIQSSEVRELIAKQEGIELKPMEKTEETKEPKEEEKEDEETEKEIPKEMEKRLIENVRRSV